MNGIQKPVVLGIFAIVSCAASIAAEARFPGPEFPAGVQLASLVVVDFDADGLPDAISVDRESGAVIVSKGRGDGRLEPPVAYPVGPYPSHLAVADLNGDGELDVVTAIASEDHVVVLLGDGEGRLGAPIVNPGGDGCSRVAVADLDGDTLMDVVTSNIVTRTMSVQLGNGDGTLEPPADFGFGDYPNILPSMTVSPRSFDVVDVDGDERLDLVVGTWPLGISVFLGNGDGSFQDPIRELDGDRNSDVTAVANLDADGLPDLLTIGGRDDILQVFPGEGDGTFGAPTTWPAGQTPNSLLVADVDEDGNPDVTIFSSTSDDVRTWLGSPDGSLTLSPQGAIPANEATGALAAGDLDGDGDLDLLSALGSGYVGVRFGNGDGTFQVHDASPVGDSPLGLASADLNRDDVPDGITLGQDGSEVSVALGNGDGTLGPPMSYPLLGAAMLDAASAPRIAVVDLDGDGAVDVVTVSAEAAATNVLLGNGDGTLQPAQSVDGGDQPTSLAIGDFDGDGIADIATSSENAIRILIGNGTGGFQTARFVSLDLQPSAIAALDADGDGALDLAVLGWDGIAGALSLLRGNGDATFLPAAPVASLPSSFRASISASDANGDEVPDLVTSHYDFGDDFPNGIFVLVHLGRGNGTFETLPPVRAGRGVSSTVLADVDGDGIVDLVVANTIDDNLSLHRGHGDGTFGDGHFYATGNAPFGLAVTDADGDGRPDLWTANAQSSDVSILLNRGERPVRHCDVDRNGAVDRLDLREILRSWRARVEPGDPRDANGDGRVNGRDAWLCSRECDLPHCKVVTGCGLLGVEPALVLLGLGWHRRRRPARPRPRADW